MKLPKGWIDDIEWGFSLLGTNGFSGRPEYTASYSGACGYGFTSGEALDHLRGMLIQSITHPIGTFVPHPDSSAQPVRPPYTTG